MAQTSIPVLTTAVSANDQTAPSTIVMRDAASGIYGALLQGSTLQTTGNLIGFPVAKSASFTAGAATHYVVDCTSAAVAVAFPTASANTGVVYTFVKKDSVTANALTFTGVNGTASVTAQYAQVTVFCDGTSWFAK